MLASYFRKSVFSLLNKNAYSKKCNNNRTHEKKMKHEAEIFNLDYDNSTFHLKKKRGLTIYTSCYESQSHNRIRQM